MSWLEAYFGIGVVVAAVGFVVVWAEHPNMNGWACVICLGSMSVLWPGALLFGLGMLAAGLACATQEYCDVAWLRWHAGGDGVPDSPSCPAPPGFTPEPLFPSREEP